MALTAGKAVRDVRLPPDVAQHLDELLGSPEFAGSERRRDLLRFLVEETYAERAASLKAYVIGTQVLNRPPGFDPQTDPIVRVEIGRLRSTLDRFYRENPEARMVLSVPKGQNAVVVEKRPRAHTSGGEHSSVTRIAVLPFADLGTGTAHQHLADGLAEELGYRLSRSPDLSIVTGLPREVFGNATMDGIEVSRRTGARFVIRGSVRVQQSSIRVNIRLFDAELARDIWLERLDAPSDPKHIFELEDRIVSEIAGRVADDFGVLNRHLAEAAADRHTSEIDVHTAMLLAHHSLVSPSRDRFVSAARALEGALVVAPAAARALAALSDIRFTTWWLRLDEELGDLGQAEELALRAVRVDGECSSAHMALAYVHFGRRRSRLCELELAYAMDLDPHSPTKLASAGLLLALEGKLDEGQRLCDEAVALNPFVPAWWHVVPCLAAFAAGEFDVALIEARAVGDAGAFAGPMLRLAALGHLGHLEGVDAEAQALLDLRPDATGRDDWMSDFVHDGGIRDLLLRGMRATEAL